MQNATIIIQITAHSNVMHTNNMYGACCLVIFVQNAHENTSRKLSVNSNGYLKVLILLGQGILKLRQKNDMIEPERGWGRGSIMGGELIEAEARTILNQGKREGISEKENYVQDV